MYHLMILWNKFSRIASWLIFLQLLMIVQYISRPWDGDNNISNFLSIYCKTLWYSYVFLILVVASYYKVFQHCVDKSKLANETLTNKDIFKLMEFDYFFAINKLICILFKTMADSIIRLQSIFTLDQVFAKLIKLYTIVKYTEVTKNCSNFKVHMIKIIWVRASKFDHSIYFVALILNLQYQSVAVSKKKTYNNSWKDISNLAKGWSFTKTYTLLADLKYYINRSKAFTNSPNKDSTMNFWYFVVGTNALLVIAMKTFSIAPHIAAMERLFS